MVQQPDKWAHFVAQLIQRTQENKIRWTSYVPKAADATIVDKVYTTKHEDKALQLYLRKPRHVEGVAAFFAPSERVVLRVVDKDGTDLWTFPESPALHDLLTAVKYQVARIDDFFAGLLGD